MAQQLSFHLPAADAQGREDFFVSPANELALALVDLTGGWPDGKLVLCGPKGSGKTHLTRVWADQTGARILRAARLREDDVPDLAISPVAIEDVPEIAGDPVAQNALFHLHNLMRANCLPLMMTGRGAVRDWGLTLPDLISRLCAAQCATLEMPDDTLLAALLAKLFNDRQVTPKPDLIPYLLRHMDRSFDAAAEMVDQLDRLSLAQGRKISRHLAMQLIGGEAETS